MQTTAPVMESTHPSTGLIDWTGPLVLHTHLGDCSYPVRHLAVMENGLHLVEVLDYFSGCEGVHRSQIMRFRENGFGIHTQYTLRNRVVSDTEPATEVHELILDLRKQFFHRLPRVGLTAIAAERYRQIFMHDYDAQHDQHRHGHSEDLVTAAGLIALGESPKGPSGVPAYEIARHVTQKHHGDRRRQLAIAGALIAAELDRIDYHDHHQHGKH